jgi:multidrug efflux pump subunit AcrA (membrane-fusion protein)
VKYAGDEGGMRWGNDQRIAAGQKVFEGQVLLQLPDTSKMVVSTRIHEADRHKIREGLTCLVRVPAVPDQVFTGKLGKIAQFADSAHRWFNPELKEHTADILLDDTTAPVSPGDTAQIEIQIETVEDVLAAPVQCVHSRGSKNYVFVRDGRNSALREVSIGRASTTFVEILSGLSAGDEVFMHATEEMLTRLPSTDNGNGPNGESPVVQAPANTGGAPKRSGGAPRPSGERRGGGRRGG